MPFVKAMDTADYRPKKWPGKMRHNLGQSIRSAFGIVPESRATLT